jgi:NADH:ubiquinone oxidoreductase subunit
MEPIPDPDSFIAGWIYTSPTGEQIPLRTNEVIQEKRPNPLDPYRGAGPVASILPNIQQQRYATEYQRNLFLNGADPGGVITVPNKMSERDFDELVDRWRESHRGVARAGQVGVLENGAVWTPNAHSNKDMEYGQLRLANRDELREAWRIHKAMMGSSDDVNRANAQTAQEIFVAWQVLPRLNRRRDTLNCKLLPLFGGADKTVEFDYEDPSPVNAETAATEMLQKAQAAAALLATGVFNPRDVLEAVGLPDMDVQDVPAAAAPPAPAGATPPPNASELGDQGQNLARPSITMGRPRAAVPEPPPHNLDKLDEQWKKAVAAAVILYLTNIVVIQRKQITEQIIKLVDAGDITGLTAIAVDSAAGAKQLTTVMAALAAASADMAVGEAAKQGATIQPKTPDRAELAAVAETVAALAAASLSLSAGAQAARVAMADTNKPGVDVAEEVEQYLDDASDASLTSRISGAMSAAQNGARIATFLGGQAADLFASEINDKNTCRPCRAIDGQYIGNTLDDNIEDQVAELYPNGGYIDCSGGDRCRGTIIAAYGAPTDNIGNRYGLSGVRAAKDPGAKVFQQAADSFPPQAVGWMHHADWSGPAMVPLQHIDWTPEEMQNPDPDRVDKFCKELQDGKKLKPVILVKTPGSNKLQLVDGHHRFLAAAELQEPVRAFIGVVDEDEGPWETMHDMQYPETTTNKAVVPLRAAATLSKQEVNYRAATETGRRCGTCSMFRGPNSCTLVKGVISPGDVCDRWAAKTAATDHADLVRRIQNDGYVPVQIAGRQ